LSLTIDGWRWIIQPLRLIIKGMEQMLQGSWQMLKRLSPTLEGM
jgi:hypothetical protein